MSYSSEVLADAPAAFWRLGTGATDVNDASGNSRTLTKTGTPTEVTGLLTGDTDKARDFPGAITDYYEAADHSSFDFAANAAFTLECWAMLQTTPTDYQRIVCHDDATQGWILFCHQTDGYGIGRRAAGSFALCKYKPTTMLDLPFHVVGTYDGSNLRLYLNGALVAGPIATTSSIGAIGTTVRIGRDTLGSSSVTNFQGVLDDVAVYPGALSLTRINAHYAAGLATNYVTADFVLPWSSAGAPALNALGVVPSTQGVPRVWEGYGRDPTATDDQTIGASVGDFWIGLQLSGWLCLSAATGAAVWKRITQ